MKELEKKIDSLNESEKAKAIIRLSKADMIDTMSIVNSKTDLGLSIRMEGAGNSFYLLIDKDGNHLARCKRAIEMFRILEGMLLIITISEKGDK